MQRHVVNTGCAHCIYIQVHRPFSSLSFIYLLLRQLKIVLPSPPRPPLIRALANDWAQAQACIYIDICVRSAAGPTPSHVPRTACTTQLDVLPRASATT
jgi:hypothetical protein